MRSVAASRGWNRVPGGGGDSWGRVRQEAAGAGGGGTMLRNGRASEVAPRGGLAGEGYCQPYSQRFWGNCQPFYDPK